MWLSVYKCTQYVSFLQYDDNYYCDKYQIYNFPNGVGTKFYLGYQIETWITTHDQLIDNVFRPILIPSFALMI